MKSWIVPQYLKVGFFWFAILMLMSLVALQLHKRMLYEKLHAESVMRAQDISPRRAPVSTLLSPYQGRWMLVHFWATWCPPCRTEMPSLELLNRKVSNEMIILAVSVDENWSDVGRFFAGQNPSLILLSDKGQQLSDAFGVGKFPETFLVAPDGQIRAHFVGPRNWDSKESLEYLQRVMATKQTED